MQKTERHHVVPISMGGFDVAENIIHISFSEHKELHNVLNIPYSSIRTYRLRTNHILFPTPYSIREMMKVQSLYFKKSNLLKRWLNKKQAESLELQAFRLVNLYNIKGFKFSRIYLDEYEHLYKALTNYHQALLMVVQKGKAP